MIKHILYFLGITPIKYLMHKDNAMCSFSFMEFLNGFNSDYIEINTPIELVKFDFHGELRYLVRYDGECLPATKVNTKYYNYVVF